jgi:adenosylhomocysteine nucleosidase
MKKQLVWLPVLLAMLVTLFTQPVSVAANESLPPKLDGAPRIAIISAFGAELEAFKALANITRVEVVNGRSVYLGTLAGHKVLMTLSGVSMTNAAMSTQVIIDKFNVTQIVFSGIAGGVNPNLSVGDVVVPAQWSEYQENFFAREVGGVFTPPFWFTQTLANFGMMFPQPVEVTVGEPDVETAVTWFQADPEMLAVAESVADNVILEDCVTEDVCLTPAPVIVVGGNGVSGPTFVDNAAYRDYVWDTWQADALDMESAAVAHVATVNGVPFVIFRSLSDLAGGGPGENEIGTFFQLAANNSAKMMLEFLSAWE